MRALTLRTRIAAVASVCVALAVLAAAIGAYAAVRSDLRGEVDSALRSRARVFTGPPGGGGPGGDGGPGRPGGPAGQGGFPGSVQPEPFGAASGYVQFVSPQGTIYVPEGQGSSSATIALTAQDRAIAASASGSSLTDRSVKGTQLRVLTVGVGGGSPRQDGMAGAVMVAQPLTQVDHELGHLLLILVLIGARGARADRALHGEHGDADGKP
jgi:two-component system sensor histidine kinase MprB